MDAVESRLRADQLVAEADELLAIRDLAATATPEGKRWVSDKPAHCTAALAEATGRAGLLADKLARMSRDDDAAAVREMADKWKEAGALQQSRALAAEQVNLG